MPTKKCTKREKCVVANVEQDLSAFGNAKWTRDGLAAICRGCQSRKDRLLGEAKRERNQGK